MRKLAQKAFTLVEIMIVVAIIGIIIAIAVPAFLRARENARGMACQENLKKIDSGKDQYAMEFKLPPGTNVTIDQLLRPGGQNAGYIRVAPQCPAGGSYAVNPIETNPTCNISSSNAGFTPHVLVN